MSAAASAPSCFPIANMHWRRSPPSGCAKPVKWICDRTEHFLGDSHGRDNISTRAAGARRQGAFPRARARYHRRHGRVSVVLCALHPLARRRHGDRRLRHSGRACAAARGLYQHRAGRCLSRRRTAGGLLSDRAAGRCGGARSRHRAGCVAPQEPDQAEGAALHDADRQGLRLRRFRRHTRARAGDRRLGRLQQARRRNPSAPASCAASALRPISRPAATTGRKPRPCGSIATAASPC